MYLTQTNYSNINSDDLHQQLLVDWVKKLQSYQITNTSDEAFYGGLMCPACGRIHGRCIDAIIAFLTVSQIENDSTLIKKAEDIFWWAEKNIVAADHAYINDQGHPWKGPSIFTLIHFIDVLEHYSDVLSPATLAQMKHRVSLLCEWVYDNIDILDTNVNYYLAAATALFKAAQFRNNDQAYFDKAHTLAHKYLGAINKDGLIQGEGKVRGGSIFDESPKGGQPLDIGYNVEENLASILEYGLLADDAEIIAAAKKTMHAHLNFMMTDGGWDNSFGSRNTKWSYWGSRTSDGSVGAYALLQDNPEFQQAAYRNLKLLATCTHDGLLTGGPEFYAAGEPTCIHHTFCHAKCLAIRLITDHKITAPTSFVSAIPDGVFTFNNQQTVSVRRNGWYGSVNVSDFVYEKNSTPTGGTVGLLYHAKYGGILAATMNNYKLYEPENMQFPLKWETQNQSLRLEGTDFVSSKVLSATLRTNSTQTDTTVTVEDANNFKFDYTFTDNTFQIKATSLHANRQLILPVIASLQATVTLLNAHTLTITNDESVLTVQSSATFDLVLDSHGKAKTYFNPVGGYTYIRLISPLTAQQPVTFTLIVK